MFKDMTVSSSHIYIDINVVVIILDIRKSTQQLD